MGIRDPGPGPAAGSGFEIATIAVIFDNTATRHKEMALVSDNKWWDSFYKQHDEFREWYLPLEVVVDHVVSYTSHLQQQQQQQQHRALHVGCGTSELPFTMAERSPWIQWWHNIDYSPSVIANMQRQRRMKEPHYESRICFEAMDVCDLRYDADFFDIVVDKGTFDCVYLCGVEAATAMFQQLWRVMSANSVLVMFSLYDEPERRAIMQRHEWHTFTHIPLDITPLEHPDRNVTHMFVFMKTRTTNEAE